MALRWISVEENLVLCIVVQLKLRDGEKMWRPFQAAAEGADNVGKMCGTERRVLSQGDSCTNLLLWVVR
jgi:hypothetical protein